MIKKYLNLSPSRVAYPRNDKGSTTVIWGLTPVGYGIYGILSLAKSKRNLSPNLWPVRPTEKLSDRMVEHFFPSPSGDINGIRLRIPT